MVEKWDRCAVEMATPRAQPVSTAGATPGGELEERVLSWRAHRNAECERFAQTVYTNNSGRVRWLPRARAHIQGTCKRLERFFLFLSGDSANTMFMPEGSISQFKHKWEDLSVFYDRFAAYFDGDCTGLDRFEYCADPWLFLGSFPAGGGESLGCVAARLLFPALTRNTHSAAEQAIAWQLNDLLVALRFRYEQTVLAPLTAFRIRSWGVLPPPLADMVAEYVIHPPRNEQLRRRARGIMVASGSAAYNLGPGVRNLFSMIHNEWHSNAQKTTLVDLVQTSQEMHLRFDRVDEFVSPLLHEWKSIVVGGWTPDEFGGDPSLSFALGRWMPPNCPIVDVADPEFGAVQDLLAYRYPTHQWIFHNKSLRIPLISAIIHHFAK